MKKAKDKLWWAFLSFKLNEKFVYPGPIHDRLAVGVGRVQGAETKINELQERSSEVYGSWRDGEKEHKETPKGS